MNDNILMPPRFQLIKHIATGGMADVFLCRQKGSEGFSKLVAIKKILHQFSADTRFIRMFTREAKLAAMLNHNNICKVYDFVKYGDEYLLIMEYINGFTLRDLIEKLQKGMKRIPIQISLGIVLNIAKALHYIHSLKDMHGNPLDLVHRDVTPSNIMISDKGEVKLMDFGIAKIEGLPTGSTSTGEIKGKIGYLSPELIEGTEIDQRSDIFSLGIIFYELLSSKRLFVGESQFTVLYKIKQADIPPISKVIPYIDNDLESIVMKCLSKNREERYQNSKNLIIDINDYALKKGYYFSEENIGELVNSVYTQEEMTPEEVLINPAVDFEIPDSFEVSESNETHEDYADEIKKLEKHSHRIKYFFFALFTIILIGLFYVLFIDRGRIFNPSLFDFISGSSRSVTKETAPEITEMRAVFNLGEGQELEAGNVFLLKENGYFLDMSRDIENAEIQIRNKDKGSFSYYCSLSLTGGEISVQPPGSVSVEKREDALYFDFNTESMAVKAVMNTSPEGAEVFMDGKSLGSAPAEINFGDKKSLAIVIKMEGYKDKSLTLKRNDLGREGVLIVDLEKKPQAGIITIKSSYRVSVSIQGRNRGRVEGEKTFELEPGRYNVRLTGENVFFHMEKSFLVRENETVIVESPRHGFVDITATPSKCRVYINGILLDQEPPIMNYKIAAGNYNIMIHWEQFNQKKESNFEIFQGERKTLPMFALN